MKKEKKDTGKSAASIEEAMRLLDEKMAESGSEKKTEKVEVKKAVKSAKSKHKKTRSRRYANLKENVQRKELAIDEAVKQAKVMASAKFDETLEIHIKLIIKKGDNPFRETIEMPGGLVKKPRVAILTAEKIEEIKKGKIDFDVAIARPEMMGKVAEVARILGPKGLMPNPKLGTITDNPEEVKQKLENSTKEIKADARGIIHSSIGKVSWDDKKIIDNAEAILGKINKVKIEKAVLSSTMGVGMRVKI